MKAAAVETGTVDSALGSCSGAGAPFSTTGSGDVAFALFTPSGEGVVWVAGGTLAGYVLTDPTQVICPTTADPTWN